MAHWKGWVRRLPDEDQLVADFTFTHEELESLTAFYDQATGPGDEAILTVRDLIEVSRIFSMITDAADWTYDDEDEETDD